MQTVILAAGKSSRFWPLNYAHKSLLKVMGKPIILYTLEGIIRSGIKDIIIVQDSKRLIEKELKKYPLDAKINFVVQDKARGMGDALRKAKNSLSDNFLVILPEVIDCEEIILKIKEKMDKSKARTILVGCKTDNPSLFGIMEFKDDRVVKIIEKPEKGKEPSDVKVVGAYLLEQSFFDFYDKTTRHQYDFENTLSAYMKENNTEMILMDKERPSLKYPWHLFSVQRYLFDKCLVGKIDKSSIVGIGKNVILEGKIWIGKNVKILENAVIKGPCFIGDNVVIGNNSLVREYVDLENNSMIGALAEVTRSIFQENAHMHAGYIGDSVLGRDCKVGAGTITANLRLDRQEIACFTEGGKKNSGKTSLGCFVGENAKIGINCSIMPGVFIGRNSVVLPHSLISKNIEDGPKCF